MAQEIANELPSVVHETFLEWKFGTCGRDRCYLCGTKAEPAKFISKNLIGLTRIRASQFPEKNGAVELRFYESHFYDWNPFEAGLNDALKILGCDTRSEIKSATYMLHLTIPESQGMDYIQFGNRAIRLVRDFKELLTWHYDGGVLRSFDFPSPMMSIVPHVTSKGLLTDQPQYLNLGKYLAAKSARSL